MSSRLFLEIREKRGLAYSIYRVFLDRVAQRLKVAEQMLAAPGDFPRRSELADLAARLRHPGRVRHREIPLRQARLGRDHGNLAVTFSGVVRE